MTRSLLALASLTGLLAAQEPPAAPAVVVVASDFIRYVEEPAVARLETAVRSYTNEEGVSVDLVGVVHIADLPYYQKLNTQLATYDVVLYELVGDPAALQAMSQKQKDGQPVATGPKAAAEAAANPLRAIQKMVGNLLHLSFQLDHIDYTPANFVHADLSPADFAKLQQDKGENMMSLLTRAMKMEKDGKLGLEAKDLNLDLGQILGSLNKPGGSDALKIIMAKVFDQAESMVENFEGADAAQGTVLLTERNKVVEAKLRESMQGGKKHLAIFFGAGHLPGLETLLTGQHFHQTKELWLSAWTMPRPAAK